LKRFLLFLTLLLSISFSANATELLTLKDVDKKDVYNFILTENLKQGYSIKSSSDYALVFEDNRPKNLDFKLSWGSNAKVVSLYNLAQTDADLLVSHEIQIITNPDSSQEKVHVASKENAKNYFPVNKNWLIYEAAQTASDLKLIKAEFNGFYSYGFIDVFEKDHLRIIKVWSDSSAEKAGLLVDDLIIKINNTSVKDLKYEATKKLLSAGEEGATITVTVSRNGKETPITMTKQFTPPRFKK
jgi:hypothetical protein